MYKIITITLLFPVLLFSQKKGQNEKINQLKIVGSLNSFITPPKYIYAYFLDGNKRGLDSFKVANGKYAIHRIIQTSVMVTLHDRNPEQQPDAYKSINMLVFYSEATKVNLTSNKNLSNTTILGSKANIEYASLEAVIQNHTKYFSELNNSLAKNKNNLAVQFSIDSINNLIKKIYYKYFIKNTQSRIKNFVLANYANKLPREVEEKEIVNLKNGYKSLSYSEKASFNGKKILKKINSYDIKVGNKAPLFSQKDSLNNSVKLVSYSGKYVLLDFWASWCAPCRKEIGPLKEVLAKFKDKNLQ